jgi:hypothetical protein
MKRIIATLVGVSLFALAPAMPASAAPNPSPSNNPTVDGCVASADVFPAETLGNCVSLLTIAPLYFSGTGGYGTFTPQICSFFMKSRPDDFYSVYDSYNECILDTATQLSNF